MQFKSILLLLFFLIFVSSGRAQSANFQPINEPAPLLFNALKDERFSAAYKKVFEAYLGLKWVGTGAGPTSPAEKRNLKIGDIAYLYFTCRPHACETEYLYFLYLPSKARGWGVINIKSNTDNLPWINPEIDDILSKARGLNK